MSNVNLCQLEHLSCFGCCGHSWTTKKEVLVQIGKNTQLYPHMSREGFARRGEKYLSACGACKSLIKKGDRILCGLHPMQNEGADYRDKICEKDYLCKTFKAFLTWENKKQDRFVRFVLEKNLTNWAYSMGMDSDKFLKEFEKR